jgi:hypothetical protein
VGSLKKNRDTEMIGGVMDESEQSGWNWKTYPPLTRFSVYSQAQVECLYRLSCESQQLLDEDGGLGANFQKIYGNFWLWVLGTYEVSRTICEYKSCFSERINIEALKFKQRISVVRMPFAKQQHRGKKHPINAEASVASFDSETKDMGFLIEGEIIKMRVLFSEFNSFVQSIDHDDVICDLRYAP